MARVILISVEVEVAAEVENLVTLRTEYLLRIAVRTEDRIILRESFAIVSEQDY
jgi:hypothetical protein